MFSFRKDKTGFFATLSLILVISGMVIATGVLLTVGILQGNWEYYSLPIRIVLGASWMACIVIVLVRIGVFGVQRQRKKLLEQAAAPQPAPPAAEPPAQAPQPSDPQKEGNG
ncbi:MAG: hypothetical protein EXR99_08860 [Gemmataceae bacterium]|nr:hypothetical protein [Gemmataceae bacterium]